MASKSNAVQQILSDQTKAQYGNSNVLTEAGAINFGSSKNQFAPTLGNVSGSTISFGDGGALGETFAKTVKELTDTQASAVSSLFSGLQQNQAAQASLSAGKFDLGKWAPWLIGGLALIFGLSLLRKS